MNGFSSLILLSALCTTLGTKCMYKKYSNTFLNDEIKTNKTIKSSYYRDVFLCLIDCKKTINCSTVLYDRNEFNCSLINYVFQSTQINLTFNSPSYDLYEMKKSLRGESCFVNDDCDSNLRLVCTNQSKCDCMNNAVWNNTLNICSPTLETLLLNSDDINALYSLGNFDLSVKWTLLYRATRDGFSSTAFHSKCDGKSNTLTLLKTNYFHVSGGFTTAAWDVSGTNKNDSQAFLFRIKVNDTLAAFRTDIKNNGFRATWCSSGNGPSFGDDLILASNSNGGGNTYSLIGRYYSLPSGYETYSLVGSPTHYFATLEIEVFQKI